MPVSKLLTGVFLSIQLINTIFTNMKSTILSTCLFLLIGTISFAQKTTVSGIIIDGESREPLSFSNVSCSSGGVTSDLDGRYSLELQNGTQEIVFSYVGYEDIIKEVVLDGTPFVLDVEMGSSITLKEIEVVADIANDRKTPVAFTNIPTKKLLEEISGGDIAAMVNTVPGAQATSQGGGDGDARITIRGFSQRNVAVMIDGIPVNDMENGWVFWSNWFGLDVATKTIQVQRGLGASKLAIPSVGGTMNILTRGIEAKRKVTLKQQVGDNGFLQTTLGFTSGRMDGGWGVSVAGSYKQGNGWVDQNYTQGGFYYLKVDKELGNHILTLSGMGAPQNHGQRSFKTFASIYDADYAKDKLGFTDEEILNQHHLFYDNGSQPSFIKDSFDLATYRQARQYNQHWGDYTNANGEVIRVNERRNFYHKPQFSLRHTWDASNKFFLSNILYTSIGNGGGTGNDGTIPIINGFNDRGSALFGQRNFQAVHDGNRASLDADGEYGASTILRASINNHQWYGLLSTFNYELSELFSVSGGVDLRTYRGEHKREVYNLIGGDYFVPDPSRRNQNEDPNKKLGVGDQYFYHNDGLVRWGGLFGLVEFEKDKFAAFVNVSSSVIGYSKIDYHLKKELVLADTTLEIGYADTLVHNGATYDRNSPGLEYQRLGWKTLPGFTFKGGAKYNLTKQHSIFMNLGYLSKAPPYINLIPNTGLLFYGDAKNEIVRAVEIGYNFKSKIFASKINAYFTNWKNKPETYNPVTVEEDDEIFGNISGIGAIHKGVELDFSFRPHKILAIEGLMSLGDWRWSSKGIANVVDANGVAQEPVIFDATGVHVGDAAQTQYGGLVRVEPIKNLYFKFKGTYFGNYYSDFNVNSLVGENGGTESWKLPDYALFSIHTGYKYKFKNNMSVGFRFNVINLFDTTYISDASNNDQFLPGSTFDFSASSAGMFVGQGRRFNSSLTFTF